MDRPVGITNWLLVYFNCKRYYNASISWILPFLGFWTSESSILVRSHVRVASLCMGMGGSDALAVTGGMALPGCRPVFSLCWLFVVLVTGGYVVI